MRVLRVLRCATVGVAVAVGAAGAQSAYAQNVISRTIDNEPVETTVTRGPAGTVVTRQPLPAPAASEAVRVGRAAYMDETVGAAPPTTRTTTRTVTRAVRPARHVARRVTHARTVTRTVRTGRRVGAPLVLAPVQRRVIYRTIVQQQVISPAPPPGYPAYPAPAYSAARTVVVPAATTTGYAITTPAESYYYDDVYAERAPPAYPVAPHTVGSVLPADVVLTPLPATAAVEVPAVRPYSYVTIDNRVLLVDPATNTVVADITP